MSLSLSSSQHEVMASSTPTVTSCAAGLTELPIAALDQLHWVKIVPKVSLVASTAPTSSSTPASIVDHPIWWPCLLFNEYVDFQDFFQDELEFSDDDDNDDNDAINDDDDESGTSRTRKLGSKKKNKNKKVTRIAAALEAKRFILSRILTNMLHLQRQPILVARLLGRSIQEHMEVVVSGVPEEGEETQHTLESYQATEYLPFTALSSQDIQRQMDPTAFAVVVVVDVDGVSNEEDPTTTTSLLIDDILYMTYMLALDLASTQRMGGVDAPNTTLRSDFRDVGRAALTKLAPTMTKVSDTLHTTTTTTTPTLTTSIATTTTTTVTTNYDNGDDNSDVDVDVDKMEENPKEEGDNCESSKVIAMTKRMKLKLQSLPLMLRKRKHHTQRKQQILQRWTATMHHHQRCRKKSTSLPSELLQKQCLGQGLIVTRSPVSTSTTSTEDTVEYYSFDNNDDDIIKGEEPTNEHDHDEEDTHDELEEKEDLPLALVLSSPMIGTAISSTTSSSSLSHEQEENGVVVPATHHVNVNEHNSDDDDNDVRVRTLFDTFLDDLLHYYPVELVVEDVLVLCNCYLMTCTNRSHQLVNYFIID